MLTGPCSHPNALVLLRQLIIKVLPREYLSDVEMRFDLSHIGFNYGLEVYNGLLIQLNVEISQATFEGRLHDLDFQRRLVGQKSILVKELERFRIGCDSLLPMLERFLGVPYTHKTHPVSWHQDGVLSEILEGFCEFLLKHEGLPSGQVGISIAWISFDTIRQRFQR